MATANDRGADVLIISEPYRCRPEEEGWFPDSTNRAAVVIVNPTIRVQEIGPRNNAGF